MKKTFFSIPVLVWPTIVVLLLATGAAFIFPNNTLENQEKIPVKTSGYVHPSSQFKVNDVAVDWPEPNYPDKAIFESFMEEAIEEAEVEVVEEPVYYYEDPVVYYNEPTYYPQQTYSNDFARDGVVYDNGYKYTYYSSNVLYHYRTPEWTVNDQGFYQDSSGNLIVASSDYAQGTLVDTPWGQGIVQDSGCASGTIDMYTNF